MSQAVTANSNIWAMLAIKRLRLEKGMTQQQLAERAGIDRVATISDLENNRGNPTLQTLSQVAEALGVTLRQLFQAETAEQDFENLIRNVQKLKDRDRQSIRSLIESLLNQEK